MQELPLLVLASASPRRRELLTQAGIRFEVCPAHAEEWEDPSANGRDLVAHNARLKADALAEIYPDRPILAADTTVALDDAVLNKPADLDEARTMLKRLSGRPHQVYTAVVLQWRSKGVLMEEIVASQVRFRQLDDATIERYIQMANPLDKAGAYGIQEHGELIIEGYDGSFSNIMGLPLETVIPMLEHLRH